MRSLPYNGLPGFADRGGAIVVEILPEELQNPRLADAVIVQNAGDFAFDVLAGLQFSLGQRRSQMVVFRADVRERRIDRQGEICSIFSVKPAIKKLTR